MAESSVTVLQKFTSFIIVRKETLFDSFQELVNNIKRKKKDSSYDILCLQIFVKHYDLHNNVAYIMTKIIMLLQQKCEFIVILMSYDQ